MQLTHSNYFSPEAEAEYMSYSQFKAFESCEEAALLGEKADKVCYTEGHFLRPCWTVPPPSFLKIIPNC